MKQRGKIKASTIILIVVCFLGLSLLLYPTIADYWNRTYAAKSVSSYVQKLETMSAEEANDIWLEAVEYNQDLYEKQKLNNTADLLESRYWRCLNADNDGMIGYIEIPRMGVTLAVYHGTSDAVLSTSVGHLDWTSLPTGGRNTHCCLSAHRGLAKAKLFTDLDMLREGDTFKLNILNEILTYEVDQIRTVTPYDVAELEIVEGKDYCTLITCTPYGINTHRLLVRGHRIETVDYVHVISEAVIIDPLIVAPVLSFPLLFTLFMMVMLKKPKPKKDEEIF